MGVMTVAQMWEKFAEARTYEPLASLPQTQEPSAHLTPVEI